MTDRMFSTTLALLANDLDGQADIVPEHINEAVNYRMLDRRLWS